jgi:hypothetical protein
MELDLEAQLSLAWRRRDFEKCTMLLSEIEYPMIPALFTLLKEMLHRPHPLRFWRTYRFWERQTSLRLAILEVLKPCPAEVVIPLLVPLLSEYELEILKRTKAMLRAYGDLAIPSLMRILTPDGHTKKTRIGWNIYGSDRALQLLGETRSTEVIPVLELALQDRAYSYDRYSSEARLSASLPWVLLFGGIGSTFHVIVGIIIAGFTWLCAMAAMSLEAVEAKSHIQHSAWKALVLIPNRTILFLILPFVERHGYLESLNKRDSLALAETLRLVDEAFAAELSTEHREGLHVLLATPEITLLESVLYALGYAGNRTTLYFLKDLYAKSNNEEFQQQIRLAHERITVRLTRQKESQELLRASALQEDPGTLLRPSHESRDPQEQLLRPSEREE